MLIAEKERDRLGSANRRGNQNVRYMSADPEMCVCVCVCLWCIRDAWRDMDSGISFRSLFLVFRGCMFRVFL